MTKEQFNLWKHEPVTKWFFQFLRDKQAFMKSAALEQWVAGSPWPEAVRGQIIELDELANIEHVEIDAFYGIEEKDSGAEPKDSVG